MRFSLLGFLRQHIQWQIIVPMLALFLFFGMFGIYLIYYYLQDEMRDRLLDKGKLAAHSIQYAVESASSVGGIQRYIASIGAEDEFAFAMVVVGKPAGVVASTRLEFIGRSFDGLHDKLDDGLPYSLLKTVLARRQPQYHFSNYRDVFLYSIPVLVSNITNKGKPLGEGALLLQLKTAKQRAVMKSNLLITSTLFVALLLLLGIMLLILLQHYILLPQRKLLSTIQDRRRGGKSLAMIEGENEFSILSQAFNEMLQETDKVDQLKNEFVSTVSHELRTPLTSIHGSIGLILGTCKNELSPRVIELLDMARRNSERLILLINDLLDIERIIAGQLEFNFRLVNLVVIAKKSIKANLTYALEHDVHVRLHNSLQEALVWADEHRVQQVFANLLSNAIKFSNKGGEVNVSIHETEEQYWVCIEDHGRGIPDSFRKQVFQRFAQADSSDTRDRGGTGLGLNICKMIVEEHAGSINYTSIEGEVTRFFFDIPKYRFSRTIPHNEAETTDASQAEDVLL